MKKIPAGVLTVALCLSMTVPAFATEIDQDTTPQEGTTTLSASKAATYVVAIPEKAEIVFDTEVNPIGEIEYKEGNLEPDAYVTVTLSEQTPLANNVDDSDTIPYEIQSGGADFESVIYDESTEAGTKTPLSVNITKEAWEAARSGNYTASLTFMIQYTNPHVQMEESDVS